jgi:NTP pyrophosphatase (non-canonical NTP hydrolase)
MHNLRKEIADFCTHNNLICAPEFRVLDALSELGELAKELLKSTDYGKTHVKGKTKEMELELGDCLFSLICLANSLDISLSDALAQVMAKYKSRITKSQNPGSSTGKDA